MSDTIPKLPDYPARPKKPWTHRYLNNKIIYDGLSTEAIAKFKEAVAVWNKEAQLVNQERRRLLKAAAEAVRALGFPASVSVLKPGSRTGKHEVRTIEQLLSPLCDISQPYVSDSVFEEERWLEKEKQEASEATSAKRLLEYRDRAIAWLISKGKVYGQDFTAESAIHGAEDIAFEEEQARKLAEGGLFLFNGDDSCEDCEGWDGKSHRCECGNRRVSWVWSWGATFDKPAIHGEAY